MVISIVAQYFALLLFIVSQALRENTYPFLAVIVLRLNRMTVVARIEGSLCEIVFLSVASSRLLSCIIAFYNALLLAACFYAWAKMHILCWQLVLTVALVSWSDYVDSGVCGEEALSFVPCVFMSSGRSELISRLTEIMDENQSGLIQEQMERQVQLM